MQQGTIVAYVNHTFTDQVAGFGGSVKRGVGEHLMVKELQSVFAAQRAKVTK